MAWRPSDYVLDGELDNSAPGRVTGWMRFVGLKKKVTFDLVGDFHRDIRGAKIRFSGDGQGIAPVGTTFEEAAKYMDGFALHQTGKVGDMTAGLPPYDYVQGQVYLEWYSDVNGRVVIELQPEQLQVIGQPVPWVNSAPVSRQEQQRNMANFLTGICQTMQVPAMAVAGQESLVSDPKFSHWVIVNRRIVGEAHSVEQIDEQQSFAFVRLYARPEDAEYGHIPNNQLLPKVA